MAKLTPEEAQSLAAVFSRMKKDSAEAEARLTSMLSTQDKGLRKLQRQFKKLRVTNIKEIRKSEAAVKSLTERWEEATDAERKQLPILKQNIREHKNANKAISRLSESTSVASRATDSLSRAFSSITEPIRRYLSLTGLLSTAIDGAMSIYRRWTDLQTRTTAAMGEAARMMGGTAEQMQAFQHRSEGLLDTFSLLDEDVTGIAGSFQHVREVSLALRTSVDQLGEGVESAMLRTARGFGIGNDAAGNLFRMIEHGAINTATSLDDFGVQMMDFAESIGANTSQLMSQFGESRDIVAEFGNEGVRTFQDAAIMANEFGFETRRVVQSMRGFDTFRGASQSVNQLNAMLGTTLSSYEMMLEQSPVQRIEMLRNSLNDAGQSWDTMNRMQRRALTEASGFSESELAMMLGPDARSFEEMRAEQEANARSEEERAERRQRAEEIMTGLLMRTSVVWDTIGRQIERVLNAVTRDLAPIFEAIHEQAQFIGEDLWDWVTGLTGTSDAAGFARTIAEYITDMGKTIREVLPVYLERVRKIWEGLEPQVQSVKNWFIEMGQSFQNYDWAGLWKEIKTTWEDWYPTIRGVGEAIYDALEGARQKYVELRDIAIQVWNSTPVQMFLGYMDFLATAWSTVFSIIGEGVSRYIDLSSRIWSGISSGISTLISGIQQIWAVASPIVETLSNLGGGVMSFLSPGWMEQAINTGAGSAVKSSDSLTRMQQMAMNAPSNIGIMARGGLQQLGGESGTRGNKMLATGRGMFDTARSAVASSAQTAATAATDTAAAARQSAVEFRNIPVQIQLNGRELGRGIIEASMRTT